MCYMWVFANWHDTKIKCNSWTPRVFVYLQKSSRKESIEKEAAKSKEKMGDEPLEEEEYVMV